jgi:hypothetical protein
MVVSGSGTVIVDAEVPDGDAPIVIQSDQTIRLPTGPRERAYALVHQQCVNYLRENEIERVFIMASAVTRAGGGVAHLESAELRGVVTAAAASVCPTEQLKKASISKTFGERKADQYLADEDFWDESVDGVVRAGSRMAALLLLAARKAA